MSSRSRIGNPALWIGLCAVPLLLLTVALFEHQASAAPPPAPRDERDEGTSEARDHYATIGEIELPVYSPVWGAGSPLQTMRTALESGDRPGAAAALTRYLREWNGEPILPEDEGTRVARSPTGGPLQRRDPKPRPPHDPWFRIAPPWETLARWFDALPDPDRTLLLIPDPSRRIGPALRGVDPPMWFPGFAQRARLRRGVAWLNGDLTTAWLLDRSTVL
ncbi:MAG: hypothetical protein KDC38_18910, partial [Planctomycetes bacterium]|nr:hypothetical protein [Planctomycetota bacterium]